ncbi:MAG TPA: glutathione S-transferase family protein [Polyangiaceae bacterium]|nr:glutathione S-transferase family protein [Polyangiaceae bacterium]
MSLVLYYHPLASFCWKVLIALYEHDVPFEGRIVDLADEASRAELDRIWPVGKFPVIFEPEAGVEVPESSIIVEYLEERWAGKIRLFPSDPALLRDVRLQDRFFDFYVHQPMQKIVTDRIRPAEARDPYGVAEARHTLETSYGMIERRLRDGGWFVGDAFSLADCSAFPALYYANRVAPLGDALPRSTEYLQRLLGRPSIQRVLTEAEPYFRFFPA